MLRTLGYESIGLVSMLSLRTILFAIPGFVMGFIIMILLMIGFKLIIYNFEGFEIYSKIENLTIIVVSI